MQPIDALTQTDRDLIRTYISLFGNVECGPIPLVLREWNKNKSTLFKAFGKQLLVSKQIEIPSSIISINSKLASIYRPYIITNDCDIRLAKDNLGYLHDLTNNIFIADLVNFWVSQDYCLSDLRIISTLFKHVNLNRGYIKKLYGNVEQYHCQDFKCTIAVGMKTIRTIQKVLKAMHYNRMDLFEIWRNEVSLVQVNASTKAKLVLSIHPIDFMSMSDNTCNWRSCMSWQNNGCYHAGTLEMMNSNLAAVAYLESDSPFDITFDYTGEVFSIPNKSWRSLVFIHKDIILCGKSYPYTNDFISKVVLEMTRELVKKNLNWNYQYKDQEYRDLENWSGNYYIRDYFDVDYDRKKKHHCIFFYTHGMYNDIIESHQRYLCCRNYISKSKKICLSGPATCICCGNRIEDNPRDQIYSYDDLGSTMVCYECEVGHKCHACGKIHYKIKYNTIFGKFCSKDCIDDYIVFPDINYVYRNNIYPNNFHPLSCKKDDMVFGRYGCIALFVDPDTLSDDELLYLETEFAKGTCADDAQIFIRNTYQKYLNLNISFYKVPEMFPYCGIIRFLSADNYHEIYDSDWNIRLYIIKRISQNDIELEKKIKALRSFVSLREYLHIE